MSVVHPGRWWHRDEASERIICDLCPRHCSMKEGDRGFCFVRKVQGDQLILDTYGKSTGFCIDPIEKKPLNHFFPGTSVLSFGTAGCNLGCQFCQNWDISKSREVAKLSSIAEPETIAAAAKQLGCRSVAFTYNDPVIWAEYAMDTAKACREQGIQSVAVTAGYISPEARREFYSCMDAANVDLKAFSEDFYRKITYSHLEPVLDTLRYLKHETNVWFEITNLVIPNSNDSKDEIQQMCDWIVENLGPDVPLHFSAFHPDFRMTDRPRTPHETLLQAQEIAKGAGIRFAYIGNVHDVEHSSTYCWACGHLLIERDWYQLGRYGLSGGLCGSCGVEQPGRFDDAPGDWGRKRVAVDLNSFHHSKPVDSPIRVSLPITQTSKTNGSEVVSELSHVSTSPSRQEEAMASPVLTAPVKLDMLKIEDLTDDQKSGIHRAAQLIAIAATCGYGAPKEWLESLGELADLHVMGLFTTLKRGHQLRGCCGLLGRPTKLKEAIYTAASRTATEDNRMPAISTQELPYLTLDISLLASPILLTVPAAKRMEHIQVGRYGLRIALGNQSGLLLPSVPVEQGWTVEEFLRGVCRKAGLPEDAWTKDETLLETFEGVVVEGQIESQNLPPTLPLKMPPGNVQSLNRLRQVAMDNIIAITRGATPNYYALDAMDGTVQGIVLTLVDIKQSVPLANWIKTSLRPGMALQSSLFEMCKAAATMLSQARLSQATDVGIAITVLFDPAHHGSLNYDDWDGDQLRSELSNCQLDGVKSDQRAIVTACGDYVAVSFDAGKSVQDLLLDAARIVRTRRNPIGVYSLSCISTTGSLLASNVSFALDLDDTRPPAVAEGFYPSNPESRQKLVAELKSAVPSDIKAKPALALMTPHAGLRYSGQIAMNVWSAVNLPRRMIIIGPKHTSFGRDWAVSPSKDWELPGGGKWPVDTVLAKKIVQGVEGMELDLGAHAREHGVEVQLPILEAITTPDQRPEIVPIAMKSASLVDIMRAAEQLANVLKELEELPLLVISSDMNHYAPEAENRRKDRLAIDAMLTGDPSTLVETCQRNAISMCGLVPAALIMQTLIQLGKKFSIEEVGYENSGKRGNPERVVGYAGVVFRPKKK